MTTHLPPQDPMEPDDALPGEAELSALYRQLLRNEPGPALDAAVRLAAAAAIASETQQSEQRLHAEASAATYAAPKNASDVVTPIGAARPRKAAPRWLIGLATAATLVLVAGVAWHMREMPNSASTAADGADYRAAIPAASTVVPAAREGTPMAPVASAVVAAQESLRTPVVHPTEPVKPRARTIDSSIVSNAIRKSPRAVAEKAIAMQSRVASMPPPFEEMSSSAPVSPSHEAYTSGNSSTLQPEKMQTALAQPAPTNANIVAFSATTIARPAAPPAPSPPPATPVPAPAPAPAIANIPSDAAPVVMATPSPEPSIIIAGRSAPMPAPAPAPAFSSSVNQTDTAKQPSDTPAQELAKINALFAQHNDTEAQRRLQQFHRDHPTWSLDSSLRARLGEP
ncbi:hypothetical protein [Rhodanobacter sp. MP1X3]|uniref:hypothetical protein n=1 Tax=Rhodanobacter sp. MP1X3 TaxID=2723086 RepID=UPI001612E481|nr:hypothetical protein [Rhodanobacter sp. MP1X3]MBB6243193.1 hypothetical protein [Rhodanobacter sp. MP1X3]